MGYLSSMVFQGRTSKAKVLDETRVEELYDNHAPWLLGVCLHYTGKPEDAEDVLHDGFIKIIRNIKKFKTEATRQPRSLDAEDHGEYGTKIHQGS